MTFGAWVYPHDLHDVPGLAAQVREAGLDTVCLAASYHALLAAVPGNPTRRVFELPGSAIYFRPDESIWRGAALRPAVAPMVADLGDALAHGRRFAEAAGAALCAWMVCLHEDDAAIGRLDLAIETVTGDRLVGAPCLRMPELRDYAVRLVRDAAARADAVQLESLHWLAQPHARHAKIDGAAPRLSRLALSVCFCRRCRDHARERGVDADLVAAALLLYWRRAWDGLAPDDPARVEGLDSYLAARAATVTELTAEVVAAVQTPLEVVCFGDATLHGVDVRALAGAGANVRVLAYGAPERVRTTLAVHRSAIGARAAVHAGLSMLPEHSPDLRCAERAVEAAAACGADSIRLYHLGLAGERRRGWLAGLARLWRNSAGRTA